MGIIDRIRGFRRIKDEGKAWDEAYKEKEKREMGVINRIRSFRRIEDKERAEEEAYKEKERREERERQQQNPEREARADQNRFNVNVIANLVVPKSKSAWITIIVLLIFLLIAWWRNLLGFRTVLLTFGVTISGLIAVSYTHLTLPTTPYV